MIYLCRERSKLHKTVPIISLHKVMFQNIGQIGCRKAEETGHI